jgi:glycosyltransferase involved in cell wall biosynthesis
MSTDNSISKINKFIPTNKITLLQNKVKCYQGKSRNIGFKNVKYKSEYVWFIDADDYLPNENVISNLHNIVKDIKYDIVSF